MVGARSTASQYDFDLANGVLQLVLMLASFVLVGVSCWEYYQTKTAGEPWSPESTREVRVFDMTVTVFAVLISGFVFAEAYRRYVRQLKAAVGSITARSWCAILAFLTLAFYIIAFCIAVAGYVDVTKSSAWILTFTIMVLLAMLCMIYPLAGALRYVNNPNFQRERYMS